MVLGAEARGKDGRSAGALRTDVMAADFLKRANSRLTDAKSAFERKDYPDVVRYCQECVELSLKAVLRLVGIEYPKVHDVSDVLEYSKERFPEWMREEIPKLCEASQSLALERGPSVYGIENLGKPPSALFGPKDAANAIEKADHTFKTCSRFYEEFVGRT